MFYERQDQEESSDFSDGDDDYQDDEFYNYASEEIQNLQNRQQRKLKRKQTKARPKWRLKKDKNNKITNFKLTYKPTFKRDSRIDRGLNEEKGC